MFPESFIKEGHIETFGGTTVRIYENRYTCRLLPNVPAGKIRNAYWQGNQVHVVLEDGYHYVWDDFNSMITSWKES